MQIARVRKGDIVRSLCACVYELAQVRLYRLLDALSLLACSLSNSDDSVELCRVLERRVDHLERGNLRHLLALFDEE